MRERSAPKKLLVKQDVKEWSLYSMTLDQLRNELRKEREENKLLKNMNSGNMFEETVFENLFNKSVMTINKQKD